MSMALLGGLFTIAGLACQLRGAYIGLERGTFGRRSRDMVITGKRFLSEQGSAMIARLSRFRRRLWRLLGGSPGGATVELKAARAGMSITASARLTSQYQDMQAEMDDMTRRIEQLEAWTIHHEDQAKTLREADYMEAQARTWRAFQWLFIGAGLEIVGAILVLAG